MAEQELLTVVGVLLGFFSTGIDGAVQCRNNNGDPVDWFIGYKIPKYYKFYYMDSNRPSWKFIDQKTLDKEDQAVGHTLRPIYEHKSAGENQNDANFLFGMYSDQIRRGRNAPGTSGHTKGVVAFDEASGFWLVHSMTCFPSPRSYRRPQKKPKFAQTLLCISVNANQYAETIGLQLRYNRAFVYEGYASDYFKENPDFSNIAAAVNNIKPERYSPPTSILPIRTLGSKTFLSFAKTADFKKDLYLHLVLPRLNDSLYVETWRRPRGMQNSLGSQMNLQKWVFDIEMVRFNVPNAEQDFKYTLDHSKWAVTDGAAAKWVCIGDVNRERSQFSRGGGTLCIQDDNVWKVFKDMVLRFANPAEIAPIRGSNDRNRLRSPPDDWISPPSRTRN